MNDYSPNIVPFTTFALLFTCDLANDLRYEKMETYYIYTCISTPQK